MEHNHLEKQLNNCLYFSTCKLARVIGKTAEKEFEITGLPPSYAFLLSIVNNHEGIRQKCIGELMCMTPSTITRFIEKLEGKGLVKRKADGKNVYIFPTEQGKLLQPHINTAWESLYQNYTDVLSKEEKEQFLLIVGKLIGRLEK